MRIIDVVIVSLSSVCFLASVINLVISIFHKEKKNNQASKQKMAMESVDMIKIEYAEIVERIDHLLRQQKKIQQKSFYKNLWSVYRAGLRPIKGTIRVTMDVKPKNGSELSHIQIDQSSVSFNKTD